ncbi:MULTISPECIES: formate C-acetyltransferase [unclassified Chelatococcus]|uniref:formate C-acetyltransferase n=1 Tax=unclassified Chelatococcus TaxID=2638111 RepID=UPI001BD0B5AE|nr:MULTISPECIES: formate C-acetyltransferase [unclassified Chelatococcus]MBS7740316.1 formate C-acetyltransferase [Chelatococcus sp. HY11]MBX3547325.1 formate C-acetyltransferase [Chelatococcus sp.]MCO5078443.1 formate C-acetyltransferase [Chelatococcus sp.]
MSSLEAEWVGFSTGRWSQVIDVRDFIQRNVSSYNGDAAFLVEPTERTRTVWEKLQPFFKDELARGVLDVDSRTPSSITSHRPGYIDRENEVIVGLQTDEPFRRAIMPFGGLRMVEAGLEAAGVLPDPIVHDIFTKYRKTHNDGVFDAYTPEIMACRRSHIITGLPDSYGRGRIIGDYRRVALYGIDRLIAAKRAERSILDARWPTDDVIREREELAEQVRALSDLLTMAKSYGCDIARPAGNAREAVQWTYLAYLAAIKEANGAAMSIGRISTFLDVFIERDLARGVLDESGAQELIDQLVQKLRIVRFLRTPEYDALFSGDPYWATECIGGLDVNGRSLVTKTSFRMLHTLTNLGPAPEPNMTVLWSAQLPEAFKLFCLKKSAETSSIQYENDDLMRPYFGDDYGIACCVSAMRIGQQMQFFGARVNLGKCLLYAINGGRDELSGDQVGPIVPSVSGTRLDFSDVMSKFDRMMEWLAETYVHAMNCIHYMHDKYYYERLEMALHDQQILRTMAFGIAGLSVVADSLSAIKFATVTVIRGDDGLITGYETRGDFPKFGNNDPRVDDIAVDLVSRFMQKLRKHPTYRNAVHTQSVLTITSNVVYGKNTGGTPDGRRAGEPFAPGGNPMHGRDSHGWLASCLSVAKLPYADAQDGISYTVSISPSPNRLNVAEKYAQAVKVLDTYFAQGGFHMNLNVINRETLLDAMDHPEKYPQLTIRVSGYAVNFARLTREQQADVISRTFHGGG